MSVQEIHKVREKNLLLFVFFCFIFFHTDNHLFSSGYAQFVKCNIYL